MAIRAEQTGHIKAIHLARMVRKMGALSHPGDIQHLMQELHTFTSQVSLEEYFFRAAPVKFQELRQNFLQIVSLCSMWLKKCRRFNKVGKEHLLNTTPSLIQLTDGWLLRFPQVAKRLFFERPKPYALTTFAELFPMSGLSLEMTLIVEDQYAVRRSLYQKASSSSSSWNADVLKSLISGNSAPGGGNSTDNIVRGAPVDQNRGTQRQDSHEVVEVQHELHLKDPLGLTRQSIPCRGMDCTHLDTFDLSFFLMYCRQEIVKAEKDEQIQGPKDPTVSDVLAKKKDATGLTYDFDDLYGGSEYLASDAQMQARREDANKQDSVGTACISVTFRCPVCSQPIDLVDLYVDPFVQHVLASTTLSVASVLLHRRADLEFSIHTEFLGSDSEDTEEFVTGKKKRPLDEDVDASAPDRKKARHEE